jgi:hypothetical protein
MVAWSAVLAVTGRGALLAAVSVTAGALGAERGVRSGSVGRPGAVG